MTGEDLIKIDLLPDFLRNLFEPLTDDQLIEISNMIDRELQRRKDKI
jgi:hypothetical protein